MLGQITNAFRSSEIGKGANSRNFPVVELYSPTPSLTTAESAANRQRHCRVPGEASVEGGGGAAGERGAPCHSPEGSSADPGGRFE